MKLSHTTPKPMHSHIQTLIEIIKQTVDQEIVSIIFFGSASTGHSKKGSDIDILIIIKEYDEPECREYWKQITKEGYQMLRVHIDLIFAEEKALDDNDLILNNPWLGPESLVKWKDFLKSWELEYTKVVMMEPVTQTRLEVD